MDKCTNKFGYVNKYPYNGVLFGHKKNEILIYAITWMTLESVTQVQEASNIKKASTKIQ